MAETSTYLATAAGFVLLFGGGELLVRGAVGAARRLGLSQLLIGMTVVAWCTSAPELVVSVGAALKGSSDIAVGNVVGSNIFNILGVLGVAALVAPVVVRPRELRRDLTVLVATSVGLALVSQTGELSRIAGLVGVVAVVAYVAHSYRTERSAPRDPSAELHLHESEEVKGAASATGAAFSLIAGLAALVIGAQLLITGATGIARGFGVSEAVIGLSLVAVGTSLPELATSVVAALRGHSDVAVGNAVGSSTFNILGILGPTALLRPIEVSERIAHLDVWVMLATALVAAALLLTRGRIGRVAGAGFIVAYAGYLAVLFR